MRTCWAMAVVALLCAGCGSSSSSSSSGSTGGSATGGSGTTSAATGGGSTTGGSTTGSSSTGGASSGSSGSTGSAACSSADVQFTSSAQNSYWSDGDYGVFDHQWNCTSQGGQVDCGPETLYACSYSSWYVTANMPAGNTAVATYPDVQENFNSVPVDSMSSVTSRFAEHSPQVGDYEVAYDIWLNGVASNGSNEVMVWVDTYNQVPAGDVAGTVTIGGVTWTVWTTQDHSYTALVPQASFTAGSVDLLAMFKYLEQQGLLPQGSVLDQICFGWEICSTNGQDATFYLDDFAIAAQ